MRQFILISIAICMVGQIVGAFDSLMTSNLNQLAKRLGERYLAGDADNDIMAAKEIVRTYRNPTADSMVRVNFESAVKLFTDLESVSKSPCSIESSSALAEIADALPDQFMRKPRNQLNRVEETVLSKMIEHANACRDSLYSASNKLGGLPGLKQKFPIVFELQRMVDISTEVRPGPHGIEIEVLKVPNYSNARTIRMTSEVIRKFRKPELESKQMNGFKKMVDQTLTSECKKFMDSTQNELLSTLVDLSSGAITSPLTRTPDRDIFVLTGAYGICRLFEKFAATKMNHLYDQYFNGYVAL